LRPVLAFAIGLLLCGLQTALLLHLGGGSVSLALALPVVVYLGLHGGNVDGAVGAAAVGYVVDLMAGGPKGLMTFLAVSLFLFSRLAATALSVRGKLGFALLSGTGTFLYGLGAFALTRIVSPIEAAPGWRLLARMGVEAILTGALAPLVLVLMKWIDSLAAREETGLLR
jgi:hypothetical protein